MQNVSARFKKVVNLFNNFRFLIFVLLIIIFFSSVFYSVFARSKKTALLVQNKTELTQDHIILQQNSASFNTLLRLDVNSVSFSEEKNEILQNLEENFSLAEKMQNDMVVYRSLSVKDPEIIVQLTKESLKLNEQRSVYYRLLSNLIAQLKEYDDATSILYRYDPEDDFINVVTSENRDTSLERANLAEDNIRQIKNKINTLNVSTERITSTVQELEKLQNRFGEVSQLIEAGETDQANLRLSEIAQDYPRIKRVVYAGLLSVFTTDQNIELFTLQNNLMEKLGFYINTITHQQNNL